MAVPTQLRNVEFVDQREKELFDEAILGEEIIEFLNSTTGKYLYERAQIAKQKATDEVFEFDPYTADGKRKYEQLKRQAWCADHFVKWLIEAIQNGENAQTQLDSYRDTE